jgi:predicted dehydrogenase
MGQRLRVGVIGTSWWADAMHLPALAATREADVVAICGRTPERAGEVAERWKIRAVYQDVERMLDDAGVEAVVVITPNDSHHEIASMALERGLHVLCEKPLGLDHREASELADLAESHDVTTLVPFTYAFMPTNRYLKRLIDEGFLGRPHHLNLRYLSGYALAPEYSWRFDVDRAGSGVLGDLASHFIYLATSFFGPIETVSCQLATMVERPHPDGRAYRSADDVATIALAFENGACGLIHASAVAFEPTTFGQIHEMDLHGSGGTLHHVIDWDETQSVHGARVGERGMQELQVPAEVWGGAPRRPVKATYHHVFRQQGLMIGDWVRAALSGEPTSPDFADGAQVQAVLDAALRSHAEGRRIRVSEVRAATADARTG